MVNAGNLNKRITFLKPEFSEDDMRQDRIGWKPYKTVWATVKPFKSSEVNFMGKLNPNVTHRIYVRYRNDITSDMRINYHDRIFEIEGPPIDIDERHELLEMQVSEVFETNEYQL